MEKTVSFEGGIVSFQDEQSGEVVTVDNVRQAQAMTRALIQYLNENGVKIGVSATGMITFHR